MPYKDTIHDLETLKNVLLERVKNIEYTIMTLRDMSTSVNGHGQTAPKSQAKIPAGYDPSASMKTKLSYILKNEDRFLHIRQIAEVLHQFEPKISEKEFIGKLYPAIADLKKSGAIVKHSIGTQNVNTFWGSKNWLDERGEIKERHKYDEDRVISFGGETVEI